MKTIFTIIMVLALSYQTELVFKCTNGNVFKWKHTTELTQIDYNQYELSEGGMIFAGINGITLMKNNEITVLKQTKNGLFGKGHGFVGGDIVFGCKVKRRMRK